MRIINGEVESFFTKKNLCCTFLDIDECLMEIAHEDNLYLFFPMWHAIQDDVLALEALW